MRRKGVLTLVVPVVFAGVGWGLKQIAEVTVKEVVQKDEETWKKVQIDTIATVKQKTQELEQMTAGTAVLKQEMVAKLAELQTAHARLNELLVKADKIPEALASVEKLRGQLATVKNVADLQGDVNKITESLLKDQDFQKALRGNVSAEIAEVGARTSQLEEASKKLVEQMNAHEEQMGRLSAHPLIGGVPYRVLHVEDKASEDYISVHQASSLKRPVGRVYYDGTSQRAQFYRLSTSTSHEVDTDGKSPVPRCHVLFRGWLPQKALKLDANSFREGEATMIEMKDGLTSEDQRLREGPGYDVRSLAIFDGYNMPFFTTGNVKPGWVEVTFEGWMAVTNGRSSDESKYKAYMGPAMP